MISFRFHVVSLTAVFLAIAIGVVVGTTYVDQAVVDGLENRVDRVSRNLDERRAENDALQDDLDRLRGYVEASADFAVTGRLAGVPVVVVAAAGIDEDVAARTVALARTAGAVVPGVVWLEERWVLEGDADADALAEAAGIARSSDAAERLNAIEALVGALAAPAEGVDPAAGAARLDALVQGGFLRVDAQGEEAVPFRDSAGTAPRILLLTSSDLRAELVEVVAGIASEASSTGLATVAAEAFRSGSDGPERGEVLIDSLPEEARGRVGIVDGLETPEGRVAAIVSLSEVAAGRVAHYGHGPGADGPLPAWAAP
jgi:hypothetical protein